jgi:hypothetical protein
MEITISHQQGRVPVAVFQISGAVTDNEELERHAEEIFQAGTRNILLDLTNVPYMATAGLRALHAIYTMLRTDSPAESDEATRKGIAAGTFMSPHLKLLKPTPHVLEVLRATGYDMFLEVHKDLKTAIASF